MVGIDGVDDAGVYQISDNLALVQTVDFFPPIVDDPYSFGQIAAANALSDVYAMGGQPLTALNIIGFPAKMSLQIVSDILQGGADKVAEAGAVIAGGHSVKDNELKYGLSITGIIDPHKIITNSNAKTGDRIILTKPIGTGILSTAIKQNKATGEQIELVTRIMAALNKIAAEGMTRFKANAATDITGFGLAGHAFEMASGSGVSIEIEFNKIRLFPGTIDFAKAGVLTGGAKTNQNYLQPKVSFAENLDSFVPDIVYDPQTSGGLLISIDEKKANDLLSFLTNNEIDAFEIGRIAKADTTGAVVRFI